MSELIQARFIQTIPKSDVPPDDIQWMPPGKHSVTPAVAGKSKKLDMTVDEEFGRQVEAAFRQLAAAKAAGESDVPYIDFNHEDGAAAGEVTNLYWAGDDPKSGGIRAKVAWTPAGTSALVNREYRRFSPQWLRDPKTGGFAGLIENIGGLVNRAAFRTITPVVARQGYPTTKSNMDPTENTDTPDTTEQIKAALQPLIKRLEVIEARAQAPTDDKDDPGLATQLQAVTARLEAIETSAKSVSSAQATERIQHHAARGAIPPANQEVVAFWEQRYQADPLGTEKVLAAMPSNPALTRFVSGSTRASGTGAVDDGSHPFVVQARQMATAQKIDEAEASTQLARTQPDLYQRYRESLIRRN